jgi:hypothetical protein
MTEQDKLIEWLRDYFEDFREEIVGKLDKLTKEVKDDKKESDSRISELEKWKIYAGMVITIIIFAVGIKFVPLEFLLKF